MSLFKIFADGHTGVFPFPQENELQVLQQHVGGLIEPVRLFSDADMIALVNEEGVLRGLPENRRIGNLYGDIIFVGISGEDFVGLGSEQVAKLQKLFGRDEK